MLPHPARCSTTALLLRLRALTERQRQALRGLLAGDTDAEIAADLRVSELEALRELRSVYAALGVTGRQQLLRKLLPLLLELHRWAERRG